MVRRRLPDRRQQETISLDYRNADGAKVTWTVSWSYFEGDSGDVGEVFLDANKVDRNSTHGLLANEAAILASIALQHGATLEELRDAMPREHAGGAPQSIMGAALDTIWEETQE